MTSHLASSPMDDPLGEAPAPIAIVISTPAETESLASPLAVAPSPTSPAAPPLGHSHSTPDPLPPSPEGVSALNRPVRNSGTPVTRESEAQGGTEASSRRALPRFLPREEEPITQTTQTTQAASSPVGSPSAIEKVVPAASPETDATPRSALPRFLPPRDSDSTEATQNTPTVGAVATSTKAGAPSPEKNTPISRSVDHSVSSPPSAFKAPACTRRSPASAEKPRRPRGHSAERPHPSAAGSLRGPLSCSPRKAERAPPCRLSSASPPSRMAASPRVVKAISSPLSSCAGGTPAAANTRQSLEQSVQGAFSSGSPAPASSPPAATSSSNVPSLFVPSSTVGTLEGEPPKVSSCSSSTPTCAYVGSSGRPSQEHRTSSAGRARRPSASVGSARAAPPSAEDITAKLPYVHSGFRPHGQPVPDWLAAVGRLYSLHKQKLREEASAKELRGLRRRPQVCKGSSELVRWERRAVV
eukprot:RCo007703